MSDNFDTNVARRKPNISERKRPVHPWDIPKAPPPDDNALEEPSSHAVLPVAPEAPFVVASPVEAKTVSRPLSESIPVMEPEVAPKMPVSPVIPGEPSPVRFPGPPPTPQSSPVPRPAPRQPAPMIAAAPPAAQESSRKRSSLSDTISIHSNFCKLDNDVSDHLMPKLSPSAQSVYLRLYRQSYGWNRNWAAESLPKLCESCNLSLQTVRKAIKELELFGCIRKEFSDYHKATVYRIFLPSDIGLGKDATANAAGASSRGQNTNMLSSPRFPRSGQTLDGSPDTGQFSEPVDSGEGEYQDLDGSGAISGGQYFAIQSTYFRGTSIYSLLESGGALPKNILTYMTDTHLAGAVDIIDEFYNSIGFSVVSRALYRKSLIDFFDMLKSGFSADDIRYSVRWTFKNSRSRPESFSLIKHTLHLAMNDFIQELKTRSAEKGLVEEKQEALQKNLEWRAQDPVRMVSAEDIRTWQEVVEDLRGSLNEHSFSAFIEPLRLEAVEADRLCLNAPPDSVSWVSDHYAERIGTCFQEHTGRTVKVEVR